jgi:acyl dehydratase
VVACYPILFAAVDAVTPAPARARMVHGEHDVTIHRAVSAGETLTVRGRPISVATSPAGARVHVELDVRDDSLRPVATHHLTAVARGVFPERALGTPPDPRKLDIAAPVPAGTVPAGTVPAGAAPDRAVPAVAVPAVAVAPDGADRIDGLGDVAVAVAADQPARYADATGDRNAVHLDADAARSAGFPGVIAHGLGVLGLVTSALVRTLCAGDASRLARVQARFSAPVFPGATLALRPGPGGWGSDTPEFSVVRADGVLALRGGRVQLR